MKSAWRIWAKALGQKDGRNNREADIIASIRTLIVVAYMVTNTAIVANAIKHWNDSGVNVYICADKPNGGYWCTKRN
jgi:hypothetical protein